MAMGASYQESPRIIPTYHLGVQDMRPAFLKQNPPQPPIIFEPPEGLPINTQALTRNDLRVMRESGIIT